MHVPYQARSVEVPTTSLGLVYRQNIWEQLRSQPPDHIAKQSAAEQHWQAACAAVVAVRSRTFVMCPWCAHNLVSIMRTLSCSTSLQLGRSTRKQYKPNHRHSCSMRYVPLLLLHGSSAAMIHSRLKTQTNKQKFKVRQPQKGC